MPTNTEPYIYDEERDKWEAAMRERGHEPELECDGKLSLFAHSEYIHNGPACTRCGWYTCIHCNDGMIIPDCRK